MRFFKVLRPGKIIQLGVSSRYLSSPSSYACKTTHAEHLVKRGLLRVSGNETSVFLQGLITNDMRHLDEGATSMYTMFLNTKGRVLYDAILYRSTEDNVIFLESDVEALPALQKHLKLFRVRRKIDVDIVDDFKIWVMFDYVKGEEKSDVNKSFLDGQIVSHGGIMPDKEQEVEELIQVFKTEDGFLVSRDPRLPELGHRILAPANDDVQKIISSMNTDQSNSVNYRKFRYLLGVGEGIDDLPPGKCFPLEANCDYLHGVSFHKGCYIGQELTARTHHTGVVRKRLMPLFFESEPGEDLPPDTAIHATPETKNGVGKLRGVAKEVGLGLLRVTEALQAASLRVQDVVVHTKKPVWWPQEAPKERAAVAKES